MMTIKSWCYHSECIRQKLQAQWVIFLWLLGVINRTSYDDLTFLVFLSSSIWPLLLHTREYTSKMTSWPWSDHECKCGHLYDHHPTCQTFRRVQPLCSFSIYNLFLSFVICSSNLFHTLHLPYSKSVFTPVTLLSVFSLFISFI